MVFTVYFFALELVPQVCLYQSKRITIHSVKIFSHHLAKLIIALSERLSNL